MAASKYDFAIEQGSSFKLTLVYKDASGTPIDLTNYCVRIIWKTSTGLLQTFSSNDPNSGGVYRLIVNDEVGKITWLIPSYITNQYNFNTTKYDLEIQSDDPFFGSGTEMDGGKYTVRLLFGTIKIVKRFSESSSNLDCNT